MNQREDRAFHARRLLVAPPREYSSRLTSRRLRVIRNLVTCGFVLVYTGLAARFLFALVPGSAAALISRLLARMTGWLTGPFEFSVAMFPVPEELVPVFPITVALGACVALHVITRTLLRALMRPRFRGLSQLRQLRLGTTQD